LQAIVKVLIVDDHPIARRGLQMVVSAAFGVGECAEADNDATALTIAASVHPDLVLLDMHMPGEVAAHVLCSRMRELVPDARIVIVTAFDASGEIRDCLAAGADGCILKDTSESDMAAALCSVVSGGVVLDPQIAFLLAKDMVSEVGHRGTPRLSSREWDVLRLLAEGRSNRAIARRLELSEATVKGHVSSLLDKLNASSRLEAVVRASDAGLI
jgi:DNA-binding NarL/FixJ family response regulator